MADQNTEQLRGLRKGAESSIDALERLIHLGHPLGRQAVKDPEGFAAALWIEDTDARKEFTGPNTLSGWLHSMRSEVGSKPAPKSSGPMGHPVLNHAALVGLQEDKPMLDALETIVRERLALGEDVDENAIAAALMSTSEGTAEFTDPENAAAWLRSLRGASEHAPGRRSTAASDGGSGRTPLGQSPAK